MTMRHSYFFHDTYAATFSFVETLGQIQFLSEAGSVQNAPDPHDCWLICVPVNGLGAGCPPPVLGAAHLHTLLHS